MKMFKSIAYTLILSIGLFSCSTEEDFFEQINDVTSLNTTIENDVDVEEQTYDWNFSYHGKDYSCKVVDGTLLCNDETLKVIDWLKLNPTFATLIDTNNKVFYFDSEKERDEYIASLNSNNTVKPLPRGGEFHAQLKVYQHKNYRGSQKNFDVYGTTKSLDVPDLNSMGWGDRISSFKMSIISIEIPLVAEAKVTFFQDLNYAGRSLTYRCPEYEHVNNLKNVPLYPGSGDNWGDIISSFHFGHISTVK